MHFFLNQKLKENNYQLIIIGFTKIDFMNMNKIDYIKKIKSFIYLFKKSLNIYKKKKILIFTKAFVH